MLYTIENSYSLYGSGLQIKDPSGKIILRAPSTTSPWLAKWRHEWEITDAAGTRLMTMKQSLITTPICQLIQNGRPLVTMEGNLVTGHTITFHTTTDCRVSFDPLTRMTHFLQGGQIAACGQPIDFKLFACYRVDIQPGFDPTFILPVMLMACLFSI